MKTFATAAILGAAILWGAAALAQPAVIPRIGQAPHSASQTFHKLKSYFSDEAASQFQLVRADARSRTIIAKRGGIDTRTWTEWAYCKVSPSHLLDSLDDGTVTLKIKVDSSGRHSSYVHVDADFQGIYSRLGSKQTTTQQCVSQGVLEQNILATAGASQPGT
jgi:hypothetical protein